MGIPFKGLGIDTRLFCWQNDLLGSDSVGGCGDPLGDSNRGNSKSSSLCLVAGLDLSKGEGGDESKEDQKLLHDELLDFPQWMSELKCWIQLSILLLYFIQLT